MGTAGATEDREGQMGEAGIKMEEQVSEWRGPAPRPRVAGGPATDVQDPPSGKEAASRNSRDMRPTGEGGSKWTERWAHRAPRRLVHLFPGRQQRGACPVGGVCPVTLSSQGCGGRLDPCVLQHGAGGCAGPVARWASSRPADHCPQTARWHSLAVSHVDPVTPHAAASQEAESDTAEGVLQDRGADTVNRPRPPRGGSRQERAGRRLECRLPTSCHGRGQSVPWDSDPQRPWLSVGTQLPLTGQHRAGQHPAAVLDAGLLAGRRWERASRRVGCCLRSWGCRREQLGGWGREADRTGLRRGPPLSEDRVGPGDVMGEAGPESG